ncbi:MAG: DUF2975 domain-containing protein [Alphaproteobacteria bacterium]|nr:DUF2975 domain-containing protein [Alphaproteobacteria bacterium]MBM3654422.1 DUF2975 domain-containing protein [Alphaproteobacteria bacterium]
MADFSDSVLLLEDSRLDSLRRRIGWLCQALRVALVAYCLWILVTISMFWSDESLVVSHFASLKVDVEGMTAYQRLAGFGVSFVIWTLLVAACYAGWRLFSGYLEGRIFTPDASGWLRSLALMGLIAALVDIAARPLMSLILTAHKAAGAHMVSVYLRPEDLSTLMLLATLLALAHIQKTAADIADEHSQIV